MAVGGRGPWRPRGAPMSARSFPATGFVSREKKLSWSGSGVCPAGSWRCPAPRRVRGGSGQRPGVRTRSGISRRTRICLVMLHSPLVAVRGIQSRG